MWAAWEADYHLNINLQMNYWPARTPNLAETAEPLLDWFELLARRGRESARRLYQSDGWPVFLATNPFGRVSAKRRPRSSRSFVNSSLDPLCGAWMAAELFDHYQFTRDRGFSHGSGRCLRARREFVLDTLVTAPDGTLVVMPVHLAGEYLHPPAHRQAAAHHLRLHLSHEHRPGGLRRHRPRRRHPRHR